MRGGISNPKNPGGRPKGIPSPVTPINPDEAIEVAANSILTGKKITPSQFKSPPTLADCDRLQRALGVSMEQFNQQLAEKLAIISDKIANRIEEKVDNDEFKSSELGFIFAVSEDKRRALDARTQLGAAQVNIQVNNYGDRSRDEIIAALLPPTIPADPVNPLNIDEIKPEDVI